MSFPRRFITKVLAVLLPMLSLVGCATVRPAAQEPKLIQPRDVDLNASEFAWPAQDWWTAFGDPQLNRLIELAQRDHPTMALVEARVRRAAVTERLVTARSRPDVSVNANVTDEHYSENYIYPPPLGGSSDTSARVGLDLAYEFDFWGRQRAQLEAARLQQVEAAVESVFAKQILASVVAQSYFALQSANEELEIAQRDLEQRSNVEKLLQLRVDRGLENESELQFQRSTVASARQAIVAAEETIRTRKHQLASLTAQAPDALEQLDAPHATRPPALPIPEQLPIDLLARRPDVTAMRIRVKAASAGIDAAKADFYPNIDLRAFFGVQALGLGDVIDVGSRDYGIGPAVHLPIFDRDAIKANLDARYAEYDMAVAQYNATVLYAVQEVADQGTVLNSIAQQREIVAQRLAALQSARDISLSRYQKGLTTYLSVLNAESSLLSAQRTAVQLRDRELQSVVSLMRALGGGFVAPTTTGEK